MAPAFQLSLNKTYLLFKSPAVLPRFPSFPVLFHGGSHGRTMIQREGGQ